MHFLQFNSCIYSKNLGQHLILARKVTYFENRVPKSVLHQNKLLYNFHKKRAAFDSQTQYRSRICPDNSNILKFTDIIYTENCVFINNCFNKDSFAVFAQNYNLCSNTHTYNTRYSHKGLLFVPTYNSISFRKKSIIHSSTISWNYLQTILHDYGFLNCSARCLKNLLTKYLTQNMTNCN